MPEAYATVKGLGEAELVIKKSRFIGRCFPVSNGDDAVRQLDSVRRSCWDATHNCYAYRIGADASTVRSSDDGEPAGTAGVPILSVLTQKNLVNALCVVTRYFGGILLGAGGLIRAYTDACVSAVENSGIVFMRSCTAYEIDVPYPLFNAVEKAAAAYGGLHERTFTETVRARIWVRDTETEDFIACMINATDGRVTPHPRAKDMRPFAS